jgi:hypothetical protein
MGSMQCNVELGCQPLDAFCLKLLGTDRRENAVFNSSIVASCGSHLDRVDHITPLLLSDCHYLATAILYKAIT